MTTIKCTFGTAKKWYHFIPARFITNVGNYMPKDFVLQKIKIN